MLAIRHINSIDMLRLIVTLPISLSKYILGRKSLKTKGLTLKRDRPLGFEPVLCCVSANVLTAVPREYNFHLQN